VESYHLESQWKVRGKSKKMQIWEVTCWKKAQALKLELGQWAYACTKKH
jgi:hypothetical protein